MRNEFPKGGCEYAKIGLGSGWLNAVDRIAALNIRKEDSKGARMLGAYGCPDFDPFGSFKLVGGIAKGRPNDEDISGAANFYCEISSK